MEQDRDSQEMSIKPKLSRFHIIRQTDNKRLKQTQSSNRTANIFDQAQSVNEYFPTSPAVKFPFSQRNQSIQNTKRPLQIQLLNNGLHKQSIRIPNESVYKLNNYDNYRINTLQNLSSNDNSRTVKMPAISEHRRIGSSNKNISSQAKTKVFDQKKWEKRVNKFLYQQSIVSQVAFNADLRTRCGDQYFQQILRERHKQDQKPKPYLYNIISQIQPSESKFVNYVKQTHPSLIFRNKLKIKGVNKFRVRTDQNLSNNQLLSEQNRGCTVRAATQFYIK